MSLDRLLCTKTTYQQWRWQRKADLPPRRGVTSTLKDRIETGDIDLQYLATEDMIADVVTKPLQGKQFRRLRGLLLNCAYVSQSDSADEEYVEKGAPNGIVTVLAWVC